jgi:DNA-binding MarR family transcriptional regulator
VSGGLFDGVSGGGFFPAPRVLVPVLLAKRKLTPNAYLLLLVVCQSGADRPDGFTTSNAQLRELLGVSDKTIRRALLALEAHGLLEVEAHERVALFTITLGEELRTLVRTVLRTRETPPKSAAVSADSAVTPADTPAPATPRKPARLSRKPADTAADTAAVPRARAELELEHEHETTAAAPAAEAREPAHGAGAGAAIENTTTDGDPPAAAAAAASSDFGNLDPAAILPARPETETETELERVAREGLDP